MKIKLPEGTTHLTVGYDERGSKMSPEQEIAMDSLNEEAKKRQAKRDAVEFTTPLIPKEEPMETVIETPAVDAIVPTAEEAAKTIPGPDNPDKCLPDPLLQNLADKVAKDHGVMRTQSLRYTQGTLAVEMLYLTGNAKSRKEATSLVEEVLQNGKALEYFRKFVSAQGGDPKVCDDTTLLPQSKYEIPIIAKSSGWIKSIDSQKIGYSLVELGAGRKYLTSKLDYGTGAYLPFKIGDKVEKGCELGKIYCNNKNIGITVADQVNTSYLFSNKKINSQKIILKVINNKY